MYIHTSGEHGRAGSREHGRVGMGVAVDMDMATGMGMAMCLGEDPRAKPIRSLLASCVDEILRVLRGAKTLCELELCASEEPAREVRVARVVVDRWQGQLLPRFEHLRDR